MIRALLPYLPLILLLGSAGALVFDRWLQRPGFALEVLTIGSIGILAMFGLVGILTGNPVTSEDHVSLNGAQAWVGRAGTGLLYGGILFGVLRQPGEGPGRLIWSGVTVWAIFAGFAELVNPGPVRESFVFLPLTSYMLWRSAGTTLEQVPRVLKMGLWFLTGLSFLVGLTPFGWVETGGSFIGLPVRLVGVTAHPNQLGPYLNMLLLMNLIEPPRRWRWLAWGTPAVMLLLTQSKTAWAGFLVGVVVIWWFRVGLTLVDRHRWLPGVTLVALGLGIAVAVTQVPSQEFLTPEESEELTTLTGRSDIWGAGIDAFLENPFFGAGSQFYEDYADRTGQSWAGQAHNEFVQTLASEGLVGMAGLLTYMFVLLYLGIRLAPASGGASLAIAMAFLMRWVTETPARDLSFEQVVVIALLVAWSRKAPHLARLENVRFRELWRPTLPPEPEPVEVPVVEESVLRTGPGIS